MPLLPWRQIAAPFAVLLLLSCAKPPEAPPPRTADKAVKAARPEASTAAPQTPERAADAPQDLTIDRLTPDEEKVVRLRVVVTALKGMRLVPPMMIFTAEDDTGSVTVVIKDKVEFSEGARLELVGRYKPIPSPTHDGPPPAPEEPIFVVERFIDLP
jgi:hypothetical protein